MSSMVVVVIFKEAVHGYDVINVSRREPGRHRFDCFQRFCTLDESGTSRAFTTFPLWRGFSLC